MQNVNDVKYFAQYTDAEMDAMHYKAEAESWRKNFEELKVKYEELQNIYVETDDELNYYRNKFVDESLQRGYLQNDYDYLKEEIREVKARLASLEFLAERRG
jgi:predicted  nucleic acid-binding Zn-ribbon protein